MALSSWIFETDNTSSCNAFFSPKSPHTQACVQMYTHACTHVHMSTQCIYVCKHMTAWTYMYTQASTCIHTCTHVYMTTHTYTCEQTHIHMHAHLHSHVHIGLHVCTHMHAHSHIPIHTHAHRQEAGSQMLPCENTEPSHSVMRFYDNGTSLHENE